MTTANREKLEEQLLELLYGELPDAEVERLEAQLEAYPDLQARLDEWHELRRVVADMPLAEPDPQVRYDVLRAARKAAAAPQRSGWWAWIERLSAAPAVAGICLAVLAGSILFTVTSDFSEQASDSDAETAKKPMVEKFGDLRVADAATPRPVTLGSADETVEEGFAPKGAAAPALRPRPSPSPDVYQQPTPAIEAPEEKQKDRAVTPAKAKPKVRKKAKAAVSKSLPRVRKKKTAGAKKVYRNDRVDDAVFGSLAEAEDANAPSPAPSVVNRAAVPQEAKSARSFAPPPRSEQVGSRGGLAQGDSAARGGSKTRSKIKKVRRSPPPPAAPPPAAESSINGMMDDADGSSSITGLAPTSSARSGSGGMSARADARNQTALSTVLKQARAARERGAHRVAVRAYETYLKRVSGRPNLNAVWFEAAQSYESLGNLQRARQLYRLVAGSSSAEAAVAKRRLEQISRTLREESAPAVDAKK